MTKTKTHQPGHFLREYTQSENASLRLDRENGILRGVKILGFVSKNHRRYAPEALQQAVSMYEGAKVNINHPKGDPLAPRDYQDRIGSIRNVEFRLNEGLFADLYFNPCHPLANQLAWDAEHAPKNVGFSHNIRARTIEENHVIVVTQILAVQSVDLVADPATTSGLYEAENQPQNTPVTNEEANPPQDVPATETPTAATEPAAVVDTPEEDAVPENAPKNTTDEPSSIPEETPAAAPEPEPENAPETLEPDAPAPAVEPPAEATPSTEATMPESSASAIFQPLTEQLDSLSRKLEILHESQNALQAQLTEFLRHSLPNQTPQSHEQSLPFTEEHLTTTEFVKKIRH